MSNKSLVLVTGVSSFVASHVVLQLLNGGYSVRGTARSAKASLLRSTAGANYSDFEVVQVDDIATGNLSEALKGVSAVIHVASPLAGHAPPKQAIESALNGTLNVLKQAFAAGVTKVVITSSWGTTLSPTMEEVYQGITVTQSDWGTGTEEQILDGTHDAMWIYLTTKVLAEKAAWKFAEEHPELDLATINPPFIYGPLAPHFPPPSGPTALGTNGWIYALISGSPDRSLPTQLPPYFCDVRDVAKAHVAALKAPAQPKALLQTKRFLISGGWFTWKQATVHLAKTLDSNVKQRLASLDPNTKIGVSEFPGTLSGIDCSAAKDLLGMEEAGYIKWKKTVEDAVESLLEAEKSWQ